MADTEIKITLSLADQAAQKALSDFIAKGGQADKSLKNLKDSGNSTFQEIAIGIGKATGVFEIFQGNLAANLVTKAFEEVKNAVSDLFHIFIVDGVKAAEAQENAINALNVALAQSGHYSKETSENIVQFAEALQRTTTFSNDVILKNSALIASMGQLSETGIKKATVAALDLSSALGRDLGSASEALGKAANGNITALQKMGVQIQKGQNNAETFNNALIAIEERFGGSAISQVNTFSGAVAQASNSFEDLTKEIGNIIIQNPAVIATVQTLGKIFNDLTDSTKSQDQNFKLLVAQGLSSFITAAGALVIVADGVVRSFQTLYGIVQAISLPIGILSIPIRALSVGLRQATDEFVQFGVQANHNLTALGKNGDGALKATVDQLAKLKNAADDGTAALAKGATATVTPLNNTKQKTAELTEEMKRAQAELKNFADGLIKNADDNKKNAADAISVAKAKSEAELEEDQALYQQKLITVVDFQTRKAAIEAQFAQQQEVQTVDQFEKDNIRLQQARAQNLITEQEYIKAKGALAQNFITAQAKLDADTNKRELKAKSDLVLAEKQLNQEKVQAVGDTFGALSSLMQTKSRELFEIGKAAAIAAATINTYEAITKTMASVPYPFNIPLAIAQGIAGFVQVANIATTSPSFEQGGIVPGNSFTGDNVVANVNSGEMILNRAQQTQLFNQANGAAPSSGGIDYGQMYQAMKAALADERIVVNVGGKTVVDTLRSELNAGRKFA